MSYADLVTLLLACFATAYAATQAAAQNEARVTAPLSPPAAVEPVPEPDPAFAEPSLRDLIAPIVIAAENGAAALPFADDRVELVEDHRGLVITLPESATFPNASAALSDDAKVFLTALADALRPTTATVRIEGHTDDVPLTGGRFGTNWELSTARASAVVLFLIRDTSFNPERLSAAGYGEFRPRVPNDSAEHRALNRRVDVVVIDTPEGDQP